MTIHPVFRDAGFTPEDIAVMVTAHQDACVALGLVVRSDLMTETVARKIIECAQTGERDPIRLRECALKAFGR